MPEGTVTDIIAEVGQFQTSTAQALNVLNNKIDTSVAAVEARVDALEDATGGPPVAQGIVSQPEALTVVSGAAPGTQLALLTAPSLTNPAFALVNPSGRYAIAGNALIVGNVEIDISNGATDSVAIRAIDENGVDQLTATRVVTITAPVGGNSYDLNFVTGTYLGGTLADITNSQPASLSAANDDGSLVNFLPNTVRRTDVGINILGEPTRFRTAYALHPAGNWDITPQAWTGTTLTDAPSHATATFPDPAQITSNNSEDGWVSPVNTEAFAIGDQITVRYALKRVTGGEGGEAFIRFLWDGGEERWLITHTDPADATPLAMVNVDSGYTPNGVDTQLVSAVRGTDGIVECIFQHTILGANFRLRVGLVDNGGLTKGILMGLQTSTGPSPKPWHDTAATTLVDGADQLVLGGTPGALLAGAAGYIMIETSDIEYASVGAVGVTTNPPGHLLDIGATTIMRTFGPTRFNAKGIDGTVGHGGWRGICRAVFTWDAGGWKAWVNGSVAATGGGGIGAAGVAGLVRGLTGKLRRVQGGNTKLGDVAGKTMSEIINRTFVRPGKALVPGNVTPTFRDDFDVDSIRTRSATAVGADLAELYKASWVANPAKRWMPRQFFYQGSDTGSGPNQINGEAQHYVDEQYPGSWQSAYDITGGELVQRVKRTAMLTVDEQAAVPDDPLTGEPFQFVSSLMTTYGAGKGGFEQAGGYWEWRVKMPTFPGSWGAIWTYTPAGTGQEMDIEELYGVNPTQTTSAFHESNFTYNNGGPVEMGFSVGADYHSYAMIWDRTAHKIVKYVDGREVRVHPTSPNFDQYPQHLLLNIAIHIGNITQATLDAVDAGLGIMRTDRVQVYQFGT